MRTCIGSPRTITLPGHLVPIKRSARTGWRTARRFAHLNSCAPTNPPSFAFALNTPRLVTIASYLALAVGGWLLLSSLPTEPLFKALQQWIESLGAGGYVAMYVVYVVAALCLIPGTVLTLVSGAVFGLLGGFLIVSAASTTVAALGFLIARYVARDKVEKAVQKNRHFKAIDAAISEGGWKVVGLLRLSPVVPFNFQNYLYGLTDLKFGPYVLASWIAMMPGTIMYVYLGTVSGAALGGGGEKSTGQWVLLGVGLLATIALTIYMTKLARSKLQDDVGEEIAEPEAANESTSEGGYPWKVMVAAAVLLVLGVAAKFNADSIKQSVEGWLG